MQSCYGPAGVAPSRGWRIGRYVASVIVLGAAGAAVCRDKAAIEPASVIDDIRFLTSAELNGRGTGGDGLDKAAAYLAGQFASAGLRPVIGNSFYQPFTITLGASLGEGNTLAYSVGAERTKVAPDQFLPFNFSGIGKASGRVVFAGYGITAPECGYDDYAGLDVRDQIVVILRHEPQEFDAASPFEGRIYSEHAQLLSKALNARKHGARAALFVADTAAHSGSETLEPFTNLPAPGDPGIPFVQLKAEVVQRWFRAAGRDFEQIQRDIDSRLDPISFRFPPDLSVELSVDITRRQREVQNIVGYLPGRTAEHVIVGAHYDHLGTGEQYSLAPDMAGTMHPGADDNASGTAGVLALARWFGSRPPPPRGMLFLAFAGEEIGLLGSTHYINHPLLPLEQAAAMINMDMVGRMKERKFVVGGAASGEGLRTMVQQIAGKLRLEADMEERTVYGSSDHTSFRARLVPVLFFFTGLHADYHRPSDTWDKIEARNTALLFECIARVADTLSRQARRPRFVAIPRPPVHGHLAGVPAGAAR